MKNILLTGVSKGLGLMTARHFLDNSDYNIYGISRETTPELDQLLNDYSKRLKSRIFDLSDNNNIEQEIFIDFIKADTPLYGFINNAAVHYVDLILKMPNERIIEQINTNLTSPILLTKYVLKNFLKFRTKGSIIHISSISAHVASEGLATYSATKGGLEVFSQATAKEFGKKGIRSNVIVAGLMNLGMGLTVPENIREGVLQHSSLRKLTDYHSVLSMIDYLLSEKADSITGHNLYVDCGTI
jgi:3-oxoacyl-[acyl-carrier protein] reductase